VELYPAVVKKMDTVFKHVDQRRARFIAIVGGDEVAAGTVTVRNVATKTRETLPRTDVVPFIQRTLSD
jgi:histidyl-tRNA synthetase